MAIPAPWYQNTTLSETNAPRTPNYNHSASDHHWVVRTQPPLTTLQAQKVDELYVSRLKTLMSVDASSGVFTTLVRRGLRAPLC